MEGTTTTTADTDCFIDVLPDELLLIVFSFVPCVERRRALSLVCSRWHGIALDAPSTTLCAHKHRYFPKMNAYDAARGALQAGHLLCLQWAYQRRYVRPDRGFFRGAERSSPSRDACFRYIAQRRLEYERPPTEDEIASYTRRTDPPSMWNRLCSTIESTGRAIYQTLDTVTVDQWS
ncbi:ankyrin repeat protein [Pandoravirus inopinatum]|uniref:Ankyrin repeat protein n=1 Tax=Pandoravirus inopinatum TaxID=1605721 RepID=A0A0B5J9Q4_9VIRU|nr:ankyrin repeat protein [Pandoravirus inopinatum]AJF97611.1 ankyrin repeat protein [Pandoravirus inopinatum]